MSDDVKMFIPLLLVGVAALIAAFAYVIHTPEEVVRDPVAMYWLVVDILTIIAFLAAGIAMRQYASLLSTLAFIGSAVVLIFTVYAYTIGGLQAYWIYVDVLAPILLVVLAVKMVMHANAHH